MSKFTNENQKTNGRALGSNLHGDDQRTSTAPENTREANGGETEHLCRREHFNEIINQILPRLPRNSHVVIHQCLFSVVGDPGVVGTEPAATGRTVVGDPGVVGTEPIATGGTVVGQDSRMMANQYVPKLKQNVKEEDKNVTELKQNVMEQDTNVTELRQNVTEQDKNVMELNHNVTEKDTNVAKLNQNVMEQDKTVTELNQNVAQLNQHVVDQDTNRDVEIVRLAIRQSLAMGRTGETMQKAVQLFIDAADDPQHLEELRHWDGCEN